MIGGLSAVALVALSGCNNFPSPKKEDQNTLQSLQQSKKGAFIILEEQDNGRYKVVEEYPSEQIRVIVRDKTGKERILTREEIDALIKEEESKINAGTSELTSPEGGGGGGGLGLGGALLASAAGAILGSYIGNKLFNNPNFQQNQMRNYKSPQAYERSKNSFNATKSAPSTLRNTSGKSGFFGSNASNPAHGG